MCTVKFCQHPLLKADVPNPAPGKTDADGSKLFSSLGIALNIRKLSTPRLHLLLREYLQSMLAFYRDPIACPSCSILGQLCKGHPSSRAHHRICWNSPVTSYESASTSVQIYLFHILTGISFKNSPEIFFACNIPFQNLFLVNPVEDTWYQELS